MCIASAARRVQAAKATPSPSLRPEKSAICETLSGSYAKAFLARTCRSSHLVAHQLPKSPIGSRQVLAGIVAEAHLVRIPVEAHRHHPAHIPAEAALPALPADPSVAEEAIVARAVSVRPALPDLVRFATLYR